MDGPAFTPDKTNCFDSMRIMTGVSFFHINHRGLGEYKS